MWEQDRFFVPKNHRLNVGRLRLDDLKQTDMTEFAPTPRKDTERRKGGRPRMDSTEKKCHFIKVGFDELNFKKLKKRSRRMKASLSSIVYDLAINGKINEPLSQEMMDCFRKLAGMANNLNQLAHEAHIAGYEDVAAADRLLSEKIDEVLNKLSELR